jgi:uncharacterized RDD family membrane protein YckC
MNCPSCGRGLPGGSLDLCPFCAAVLAVPQQGALAPDLSRGPFEPMRELPGARKRERTWKDEVRDRVRHRKQQRGGSDLPLFQDDPAEEPDDAAPAEVAVEEAGGLEGETRAEPADPADEMPVASGPLELGDEDDVRPRALDDNEDLPLQADAADALADDADALPPSLREPEEEAVIHWSLGPRPVAGQEPAPVERPAPLLARLEAALLDALLLGLLGAGVVALTARAAEVPLAGLLPSWPWLSGYLAALGLLYAGYFTGGTGRTLGKIAFGLYVVDGAGQRPGFLRALGRAALGTLGVLLAGGGLVPMLLDPARRAFHDRLFGTRVIQA